MGDDRLNRAGDFMDQRLWSRALEELQSMPAFTKPNISAIPRRKHASCAVARAS